MRVAEAKARALKQLVRASTIGLPYSTPMFMYKHAISYCVGSMNLLFHKQIETRTCNQRFLGNSNSIEDNIFNYFGQLVVSYDNRNKTDIRARGSVGIVVGRARGSKGSCEVFDLHTRTVTPRHDVADRNFLCPMMPDFEVDRFWRFLFLGF